MTKEKYFAIRIGNPKHHKPYFLSCPNALTPMLFEDRQDAKNALPKDYPCAKVVRVFVHDCVCSKKRLDGRKLM